MRLISGPNHVGDSGLARSGVVFGGGGGTQKQVSEPWSGQKQFLLGSPGTPAQPSFGGVSGGPRTPAEDVMATFLPGLFRPSTSSGQASAGSPAIPGIYPEAARLYGNERTFFPGQTFAGFSPQTEQALKMQEERALAGSPVTAAMQSQLTDTLSGQYLDPTTNPAFQKAAPAIAGQIAGRFSGAGRFGSGAMANQQREALTDLAAKTYDAERGRQIQGMLFAPTAAAQDYVDAARLAEVGAAREDMTQMGINEAIARHNFAQMEPWERLQLYNSIITGSGSPGGTVTQTGPGRSTGASAIGGGLAGAATGAKIGSAIPGLGTAWGAGIGGGLGLLAGLF